MNQQSVNNLKTYPAPFIGREKDLDELGRLLSDPGCRLITLVGPGGVGKTRLAAEIARRKAVDFSDGGNFVPLHAVASLESLVSAIADTLKHPLVGQEEPKLQLISFLAHKQMLLVLDNFEQLVSESGFLSEILSGTEGAKLLVTSREALNLQEEWLYPVSGLAYPFYQDYAGLENYDAVRLFVEQARRVNRSFSVEKEAASVVRICQALEGIPLALELAASWLKVLTCQDIAVEIQRNLEFLESNLRNVPERHRSMRAVFDESWKLLNEDEKEAFKRLSVFQGSFTREAAEKVAAASLKTLWSLGDKSLIKPWPNSRYQIHELLRQFAYAKLQESREGELSAHEAHCAYFVNFLTERLTVAMDGQQLSAAAAVEADLDNIRWAWQWVVDHGGVEDLCQAAEAIFDFWEWKSRYTEAAAALEKAVERLTSVEPTPPVEMSLAFIVQYLAWFYIRLGLIQKAEDCARRCRDIYQRLGAAPPWGWVTDPLLPLGIISLIRGDYLEAGRLGDQARQTAETQGNPRNLHVAHHVLARAAFLTGQYETARKHAQQSYETALKIQDRWFMAYTLLELGTVARALGNNDAAAQHYQASYDLRREFQDPEGMAIALTCLGEVACRRQAYQESRELYSQAIAIYQGINDRGGLATARLGFAKAAAAVGDLGTAREYFAHALDIAVSIQHTQLVLAIIAGVGEMLAQWQAKDSGLALLSLAGRHSATDHETKSLSQSLLDKFSEESRPQAPLGISEPDLQQAIFILQETLGLVSDPGVHTILQQANSAVEAPPEPSPKQKDSAGLTEREVEVLRLIVEGKSNPQIARELFISVKTVGTHVSNILNKTNTSSRSEVTAYAVRRGLV